MLEAQQLFFHYAVGISGIGFNELGSPDPIVNSAATSNKGMLTKIGGGFSHRIGNDFQVELDVSYAIRRFDIRMTETYETAQQAVILNKYDLRFLELVPRLFYGFSSGLELCIGFGIDLDLDGEIFVSSKYPQIPLSEYITSTHTQDWFPLNFRIESWIRYRIRIHNKTDFIPALFFDYGIWDYTRNDYFGYLIKAGSIGINVSIARSL